MNKIEAVVNFSGGAGSYAAAKRAIDRFGSDNVVLLFCDTLTEDEDLYRFLDDCERFLPSKLVRVADGRDIWEVFKESRFLGTNRVAVCSRILKREMGDAWINENAPDAIQVFGIDYTEAHRAKRLSERLGDKVWCPLLDKPILGKEQLFRIIQDDGIDIPKLYKLGAPHNNCGGACVRAGHAHFRWLHRTLPCVYKEWEQKEQEMRIFLDKDVSILRDRRGGTTSVLTLADFRKRIESETPSLFEEEWGGCGCFVDEWVIPGSKKGIVA